VRHRCHRIDFRAKRFLNPRCRVPRIASVRRAFIYFCLHRYYVNLRFHKL
jgi:hypothetical protein